MKIVLNQGKRILGLTGCFVFEPGKEGCKDNQDQRIGKVGDV